MYRSMCTCACACTKCRHVARDALLARDTYYTYHLPVRTYSPTITARGSTPDGADDSLRKYEDYLDSRSFITRGFGLDDEDKPPSQ